MAARIFNEGRLSELVVKDAEELAKSIGISTGKGAEKESTRTQLRNFYQEYVKISEDVRNRKEDGYAKNEVSLKMMIAKAAYASGRKDHKLSPEWADWFKDNLNAIRNAEDVKAFRQYFESFMGYFYYYTANIKVKF